MNRPKSALVAVLMTILVAVPATAQQAPHTGQLQTSEFCAGCFAYLEFPPPGQTDNPSNLARWHEPTPARGPAERRSPIGEPAPALVASTTQ
jgi:hypothetical protein